MRPLPKVVMIVLNHNSLQKLGENSLRFLKSIAQTRYDNLEIVVVDNASTDGSDTVIESWAKEAPHVKLVRLSRNMGYAGGNNRGVKMCGDAAEYFVFLNNDVEVEEDWLEKIIDVMEYDRSVAAAQPKILQLRQRELIDSLGGLIDRVGRAYDLGHDMPDKDSTGRALEVFYARGAAIAIRAELFKNLGGFDEDYFIYYEETDLCWRLRLQGYRIITVPAAKIYHLGGGTTGGATPNTVYLRRRNQLITLLKNYNTLNALRYGAALTLIYILFIVKRLTIDRDYHTAAAVFKSLLWVLRNLKKIFSKRAIIQKMRKVSDNTILPSMLSLQQYNAFAKHLKREY